MFKKYGSKITAGLDVGFTLQFPCIPNFIKTDAKDQHIRQDVVNTTDQETRRPPATQGLSFVSKLVVTV